MSTVRSFASLFGFASALALVVACGSSASSAPDGEAGPSEAGDDAPSTADVPRCSADAAATSCCCDGDVQEAPMCSSEDTLVCATGYGLYQGADCSCTNGRGPCCIAQSTLDAAVDTAQSDSASDAADAAGGCSVTSASSLPGVSIAFRSPVTCTFTLAQAAAGLAIPYDIVVASDLAGVVPAPQDAGNCGTPGSSGLVVFEQLGGGGQSYCLCDTGLCPPGSFPAATLHAGSYGSSFSWSGNNWGGPSDTSTPMGAAFPAGSYALTVSAKGTRSGASFEVTATLTIHLTP